MIGRHPLRRGVHTVMLLILAGSLYGTIADSIGPAGPTSRESAGLPRHAAPLGARVWLGCLVFPVSL